MLSITARVERTGWWQRGEPRMLEDYFVQCDQKDLAWLLSLFEPGSQPLEGLQESDISQLREGVRTIAGGAYSNDAEELDYNTLLPATTVREQFRPLSTITDEMLGYWLKHYYEHENVDVENLRNAINGFLRFLEDTVKAKELVRLEWF